jgi:hypothetical protein
MQGFANILFPSKLRDTREISQHTESIGKIPHNVDLDDGYNLKVCPKMLKQLLRKTNNTSAPRLDGIGLID